MMLQLCMLLPKRHVKSHVKQGCQKICRFSKQHNCFLKFPRGSEKYKRITKISKTKKKQKQNQKQKKKDTQFGWPQ